MMHKAAAEARLKEIRGEVKRICQNPQATNKMWDHAMKLVDEGEALEAQIATYEKAAGMSHYASPSESGNPTYGYNDGSRDPSQQRSFRGVGVTGQPVRPSSMYDMTVDQAKALAQAARQNTSFKVELGSKGIESGYFGGAVRDKAALTESGLTPNLLPPIQQFGDRGFFGLPYELTRVTNYLVNIPFAAAGIAWFRHDSNQAEAAYTQEGTTKPDLGMVITEQYTRPAKVAGQFSLTWELVADAGDEFAGRLQAELARSVYNAESNLLLNGTVAANGFNGINQVSGTLIRAVGSDTPLDALNKAFADLRVSFFEPDLVIVHPNTMSALRRQKDLQNRYILDLMAGPRGIDQTNEIEQLWGVNVLQSTQQAAGTAAVLSVQNGAAVNYVRNPLVTFYDPYSEAASNIYRFIAEIRFALATPRPGAINLVSGLPTS